MRLYDRYLAALALLFTATTVLLAAYDQQGLDLYFSVFLLEYLAVTLLFVHLQPRARRLLSAMAYPMLAGFLAVVGLRAVDVLVRAGLLS